MVIDYETNGKIQDNINASLASMADSLKPVEEEPERNIAREIVDESEENFEVVETERVISREVSEEPEEEIVVSEESVEEIPEEDNDPEVPLVVEEDEEEGVVVERGTSR